MYLAPINHLFRGICNRKHDLLAGNKLRMAHVAVISLLILLGLSPTSTYALSHGNRFSASTNSTAPLEGLNAYINKVMKKRKIPGLAIAVVNNGKVVFIKGYGVRELGKPGKVDANTLFTIGSMSKQFTAAALGTLVSAGKLSWNTPVIKYIKDFKLKSQYVTQHITLRDLLSHRSGYCGPLWMWYSSYDTRQNIIQRLRYQTPEYGFRSHFCYNNVMFLTGAQFIHAITGKTWNQYISNHLFVPLDMTRTSTTEEALKTESDIATPHAEINGKTEVIKRFWYHNMDVMSPVGGINSSARDLSHWLEMMLQDGVYNGHSVLKPAIINTMETPQTLIQSNTFIGMWMRSQTPKNHFFAYGLGLMIQNYGGQKVVWHGGNIDGMTSAIAMVPSKHLGIVVLTNIDQCWAAEGIVFHVLQTYLGLPVHTDVSKNMYAFDLETANKNKTAEKKLANRCQKDAQAQYKESAYTGVYRNDFYGTARVTLEKGHLVISLGNPDFTGELVPCHNNTFHVKWRNKFYRENYLSFSFDTSDKIVRLSFKNLPMSYERNKNATK